MALYKGFSTRRFEYDKSFTLTDVDLVKEDIMNHIFTRLGERVKMPEFGTRIPDLLFEPLDELTVAIIEEDLNRVAALDPRVTLRSIQIIPDYDTHSLIASMDLFYIEFGMTDILHLSMEFER